MSEKLEAGRNRRLTTREQSNNLHILRKNMRRVYEMCVGE